MAEPTFQQLTEQVQRLTQRVAALERELGLQRVVSETPATFQPEPKPQSEIPVQPVAQPPKPARDLESSVGLRLVNRVGAVTLILGVAFFFRYAVENNLIGERARVLLGALAGVLLLAGGEFAYRRNQRIFAQGITGAGAAVLYLSIYAAHWSYHLVPLWAAFSLLTATTLLALYLAERYRSQAIAILALFGGFLAPVITYGTLVGAWFLPAYVALLDAGFLFLAGRRGWRFVEWAALAGTMSFVSQFESTPCAVFLPIYYLLLATRPNRLLFLSAHLLLLSRATYLSSNIWVESCELLGLSITGLLIIGWRRWVQFTPLLVLAASLSWFVAIWSGIHSLAAILITPALLFAVFLAMSVWRVSRVEELETAELAAFVVNPFLLFGFLYWKLNGWRDQWAALLAIALAALYFGLAYRWRGRPLPNAQAIISTGVSIVFFTLAMPIELHAFRVRIAWGLEGAALLWIASHRSDFKMRLLGLLILLIAGLYFVSSDLTMYPTAEGHAALVNARFFTALTLSIAFFLGAWWIRGSQIPAWVPGLGGHMILLAGLSFELIDWARVYHPENRTSAESAALSVLFAAYAVLLVAIGTRLRSAGSRYMGLVLIALVVIKLYLYDIWQLETVYRFIAFAALGALLLTVSFLYSRYRESVASWLKTPPAASGAHPPPRPE